MILSYFQIPFSTHIPLHYSLPLGDATVCVYQLAPQQVEFIVYFVCPGASLRRNVLCVERRIVLNSKEQFVMSARWPKWAKMLLVSESANHSSDENRQWNLIESVLSNTRRNELIRC